MIDTNEDRKYKIVSWCVTIVTLALIIVLLLACSLKSQVPPPPPKKTFYVDIESFGGGGGGGVETPTRAPRRASSSPNYATQNAQDAPSVAHSTKTSTTANTQPANTQPQLNPNATYHGHGGTGSGGGSGSGIGSGNGSGLGPGTGGGSGGGVGYATGRRSMINDIDTRVTEEGQVSVEVHVFADGHVEDARIVNSNQFKTTITNRTIQQQCLQQARRARYKQGKEELRVIVFH